jgi:glutathione synthase/RimK-type ligase-like ATP-grasp enzyme
LLIESNRLLDTHELLTHPTTVAFLKTLHHPQLLVFKNTTVIENICHEQGYTLLNPPARFSQMVEEKISQIHWLGKLAKFLPPHKVQTCNKMEWENKPFILQFNFAHTGNGTFLIDSQEALNKIKKDFPERPVRILKYIQGPTFTNNNVVWGEKILSGAINYQITGISPFTNRPFATVGNDWQIPNKILTKKQRENYYALAEKVGEKLAASGWRGLFGIDVVMDHKTGKLYLIEVNRSADLKRAELLKVAEADVEALMKNGKTSLLAEKQKMLDDAKKELGSMVIQATEKVLTGTVTPKIDAVLIDQAVKELK